MYFPILYVFIFTCILFFIFDTERFCTKVAEWTFFEREFLRRLTTSGDNPVFIMLKISILLEMLIPSKVLFVCKLHAAFYVLFIYSFLSMAGDPLPTWLYVFIVFYFAHMITGTLLLVTTFVFPHLKNTLDVFLYGADIRAHFLGNYGSTQTHALLSFAFLVIGFTHYFEHERSISMQLAIDDYNQMKKSGILVLSGKEETNAVCLKAIEYRNNGFWHRALDNANSVKTMNTINAFFAG